MNESLRIGLSFAGGFVLAFLCQTAVWILRSRRVRALGEEAPRPASWALSYGENPHRRSRNRPVGGLGTMLSAGLLLATGGTSGFELGLSAVVALLSLPGLRNDLHDYARDLTVKPVIAVYDEGLHLSDWRRTVVLRWGQIDLAYTDPPDSRGYFADEAKVTVHIEARDGRSWRFSKFDFAPGAAAGFAELVGLVTIRTAPPDSMLRREV